MGKLIKILFISVMCFAMVGCTTEYEDSNGDSDFTLQTITDDNIIYLEIGNSGLSYEEESLAGITSSEYSAKNFNGVEQIFYENYIVPSDITIYIGYMNVEKGNFRLVVVNNEEIVYEVPIGAFNESITLENLKGEVSVHLAGESAAFEMNISVY